MYTYIAFSPYRCYYCDSSFANLLIANIDSLSNLDNLVYDIPGIPTAPLAPAPTLAKLAKITPAICRIATREAKQYKSAKARAIAGLNAGRYTTDSGLTANKDDNNAYNRAYIPPANIEEEEGSSSNDNSVNSGTSNSTNKGEGSSAYKYNKGALCCKDTLLRKRQCVASYPYGPPSTPYANISALVRPVIAHYLKVLMAFKPTSA
ncbi:hypothetical protein P8C59_000021 [Phyllachora maydis]|uniref:Uncharacterized protein n=1 Tax=Phyllachora maydis TaxID=1825666 RepID=A0AAD9HV76_9PEZI|nr:hypothetical protein P8C59_000021 [Phyllachora maydis]